MAKTYTPTATRTGTQTPTLAESSTSTRTPVNTPTRVPTRTPVTPTATPTTVISGVETWRFYYYAGNARIAVREKKPGSNQLFYLLSDHLSGTSKTVNTSGQVVAELRYTAFGETWYTNGSTPTELQYTGQRSFEDIKLYFYQSRFYDPYLNRFVQPDSIMSNPFNPVDWDRYSYVRNSPINYSDSTGNRPCGVLDMEGCAEEISIESLDYDNLMGYLDNESYQDYFFSKFYEGSGPGRRWSEEDWDNYYAKRADYWEGKENWKGADAPGASRFMSDVDKLADMIGNNKDRFVRAFGLVFGGIPSDRNWASAAYSVKQGPHDLQTLPEGPQGFNPDLLDDSNPSHHYAGLFYLGYHAGNHVARAVNKIRDTDSMPDILLGNIAADHGRLFYIINSGDLAEWIYAALSVNNAQ